MQPAAARDRSWVPLLPSLAAAILVTLAISERPIHWYFRAALLLAGLAAAIYPLRQAALAAKAVPGEPAFRGVGKLTVTLLLLFLGCEAAVLAIRYLMRDALKYYALQEDVLGRFWTDRAWLIAHVTGGILAVVLGPSQFWPGLRRRALRFHRAMGYGYVLGVVLAGTASFHLAFRIPAEEGGMRAGLSMMVLASAWLVATAMAVRAIFHGNPRSHREWMVRSYVLTFAFVTIRWLTDQRFILNLGTPAEVVPPVIWCAWAVPLFLAEVALQWSVGKESPQNK